MGALPPVVAPPQADDELPPLDSSTLLATRNARPMIVPYGFPTMVGMYIADCPLPIPPHTSKLFQPDLSWPIFTPNHLLVEAFIEAPGVGSWETSKSGELYYVDGGFIEEVSSGASVEEEREIIPCLPSDFHPLPPNARAPPSPHLRNLDLPDPDQDCYHPNFNWSNQTQFMSPDEVQWPVVHAIRDSVPALNTTIDDVETITERLRNVSLNVDVSRSLKKCDRITTSIGSLHGPLKWQSRIPPRALSRLLGKGWRRYLSVLIDLRILMFDFETLSLRCSVKGKAQLRALDVNLTTYAIAFDQMKHFVMRTSLRLSSGGRRMRIHAFEHERKKARRWMLRMSNLGIARG